MGALVAIAAIIIAALLLWRRGSDGGNPLVRKELLGLFRLKRVAAIQVLFVAILGGIVMATWPQQGMLTLSAQGQDSLLLALIFGQLVMLVLLVPGIAAVSITGEKEQNTMEMLYASRLSPVQIVIGKIVAAVSYPVMLLLSGLPFIALLSWRGDVAGDLLVQCYIVLIVSAVLLAVVSLAISSLCKLSSTAMVISYVVMLATAGATLVPAAIMIDSQGGLAAQLLHYVRALSPIAAVLSLLRPDLTDLNGAVHHNLSIWLAFLPIAVLVIAGCTVVLIAKLSNAPVSNDGFNAELGADARRSMGRRVMFLIDPKKKRKPFGRFNPLISKEKRTNLLRGGKVMVRIFYIALLLSLGLAVMSLYGDVEHADLLRYVASILIAFQIGIIALVAPSLTASTISGEIENGPFETLRLSRLRGGQIFWGKFLPAFQPAVLPILALVPGYGAICFIDPGYIPRLTILLPVIVLAVALCCAIGIVCSAFVANTARATVAAYLIVTAIFVLPAGGWWAMQAGVLPGGYKVAFISPLVLGLNLLPNSAPQISNLWPQHLMVIGGLFVIALLVARVRLAVLLHRG
jgi:ABC-type transport system involved in multi-copper enzyme maturation permease subunit